ncbi:Hypothetical protein, putative [Bodo saltans]|uniref:Uncharacterized protein n=1 Tax=Bodo saltans TaxID=75058 RepID=A0A0S4ITZ3_BODSA|nr:Hypothetical protein, putative [Bodo saltans]|eukprot:CUF59896.1 Hypothetical protein, putative [Bodo saltans]
MSSVAANRFSVKSSNESSKRLLEDAIPTFCLHPAQTRLKVISQRRRHGEGLFRDDDERQRQIRKEAVDLNNNDSSDQFVGSLFSFLSSTRFLAADGTKLRAQIIQNELESLRVGHLGQDSRWEPFVAFVGLQVGTNLQRRLLGDDNNSPSGDGHRRHQTTTSSFFSFPSSNNNSSWPPNVIRCATGVVLNCMSSELRTSPILPRAHVNVVLNLLRDEEGGSRDEPPARTLLRFLIHSNRSGLHGKEERSGCSEVSDWSGTAAKLASFVFAQFVRVTPPQSGSKTLHSFAIPPDIASWRQDTWNALITVVPRVGLATNASFARVGALMVLKQQWIFWAGCRQVVVIYHEDDDGPTASSPDLEALMLPPPELFRGPGDLHTTTEHDHCIHVLAWQPTQVSLVVGALMVLKQQWIFWAGCRQVVVIYHEDDDGPTASSPDLEALMLPPPELFRGPGDLHTTTEHDHCIQRTEGLVIQLVVLLKDLSLESYQASRSMLHRIVCCLDSEVNATTILILVEDDVDKTTKQFLEGWSATLMHVVLTELGGGGHHIGILTCTSVGKSHMFRIAKQLKVAPAPCALLKLYDGSALRRKRLGVAFAPPPPHPRSFEEGGTVNNRNCWNVALELVGTKNHDATTYSSWHSSKTANDILVSVALCGNDSSITTQTEELSSKFTSVVLCAPTPAIVEALTIHFHRHLSALRSLFAPSCDNAIQPTTCSPGHGLSLAVLSQTCLKMANDLASSDSATVAALQQWKRRFFDNSVSIVDRYDAAVMLDFDRDVRLILPIVAKTFYDALTSYLALILEQSLGYSVDRAWSRVILAADAIMCHHTNSPADTRPHIATSFKDMYTIFVECPPLFMGGNNGDDEDGGNNDDEIYGGRASELTSHPPTITLSECRDWHTIDEVLHAVAAVGRIVESYTAIGVVTASV